MNEKITVNPSNTVAFNNNVDFCVGTGRFFRKFVIHVIMYGTKSCYL